MEKKNSGKDLILLGVLFLASVILSAIYMYPSFSGKVLYQTDVIQSAGGKAEVTQYEKKGEQILWTNSMFSGMPTYQIYLEHNNNYVKRYILNPYTNNVPSPLSIIILCLVSGFLFCYALRFNPWVSFIVTLLFTYGCFNITSIEAGHTNKIYAMALMPAIWAGAALIFDKKYLTGIVVSVISIAIQIAFNHVQITYYTFLGLGIYFVYQFVMAIIQKDFKPLGIGVGIMVLSLVLGVGSNASLLWTTYEYADETIRGGSELTGPDGQAPHEGLDKGYARSWSYGIAESVTLFIPGAYGGSSNEKLSKNSDSYEALVSHGVPKKSADQFIEAAPTYWGDQPFLAGPSYMGIIAFLFFIYFLVASKSSQRWWLLGVFVLFLFMAWGRHFGVFSHLMHDYFPFYNKFRTPSMAMSMVQLCMAVGAGFGLMELVNKLKENPAGAAKGFLIVSAVLGGLCLIVGIMPGVFFSFENPAVDESLKGMIGGETWLMEAIWSDRASMASFDALRSFLFVALSALFVWLAGKKILRTEFLMALLIVVVTIDMIGVDARYVSPSSFKPRKKGTVAMPTDADRLIMQDPDPHYRVFDVTSDPFANAIPSLFHKSIGGYHAAKIRRYQDLIERHISKQNMSVINMLNTKYFIVPDNTGAPRVAPNPGALGNAWFVDSLKWAATPDDEINGLNNLNTKTTALISEKNKAYIGDFVPVHDSTASIKLVHYHPDSLKYVSNAGSPQLAVFSEVYYNSGKGWEAFVDGQPAEHIRVNYILRALKLPAGKHEIAFIYEPKSFILGSKLSLAFSLTCLVIFIGGSALLIYKKVKRA